MNVLVCITHNALVSSSDLGSFAQFPVVFIFSFLLVFFFLNTQLYSHVTPARICQKFSTKLFTSLFADLFFFFLQIQRSGRSSAKSVGALLCVATCY